MKIVTEMPTSGNFVVVWEYNGKIWSDSFLFMGNELHIYQKLDEEGNMVDGWSILDIEEHPAFNYNPPRGVNKISYVIQGEEWREYI